MDKFSRNYQITIEGRDRSSIQFGLPFSIEFDIEKNTLSKTSTCNIKLYNLSKDHRNNLRYDSTDISISGFRRVTLKAGYGATPPLLPVIFDGSIIQAWSYRAGSDFITEVICNDVGTSLVNAQTNTSFPQGVSFQEIIATMIDGLAAYNVTRGAIGAYPGTLTRGNTYSGNAVEILSELTGGGFFIDNLKAHALNYNEYIASTVIETINSKSGLLGTPMLESTLLHFDMIFDPRLFISQLVKLESSTADSDFNGYRRIITLGHRAMISPAVCGEAVTSLGLSYGFSNLNGGVVSG